MRTPRRLLPFAVRVIALILVSIASLNLALSVAQAVFLGRQGQRDPEVLPLALAWLVVLTAGLMLYARGNRLGDRVGTAIERRWGAI
jgi:hypothetical protein